MKTFIASILFLFMFGVAGAQTIEFANYTNELKAGGPVVIQNRNSPLDPSPYQTGYLPVSKTCYLLVNTAAPKQPALQDEVALMHEAGHCHALRLGLQDINAGATRYGEGFADVFALAWISTNDPSRFQEAAFWLLQRRNMDRQVSPAYNTLLAIRMAMVSLPSGKGPVEFTRGVVGEPGR